MKIPPYQSALAELIVASLSEGTEIRSLPTLRSCSAGKVANYASVHRVHGAGAHAGCVVYERSARAHKGVAACKGHMRDK